MNTAQLPVSVMSAFERAQKRDEDCSDCAKRRLMQKKMTKREISLSHRRSELVQSCSLMANALNLLATAIAQGVNSPTTLQVQYDTLSMMLGDVEGSIKTYAEESLQVMNEELHNAESKSG